MYQYLDNKMTSKLNCIARKFDGLTAKGSDFKRKLQRHLYEIGSDSIRFQRGVNPTEFKPSNFQQMYLSASFAE